MVRSKIKNIFLFVLGIFTIFLGLNFVYTKVYAEDLCPKGMTAEECLDYLQNEYNELQDEKANLQNKLKDEEYQQLSLNEKISYLSGQISQSEKLIEAKEVEIKAQTVEISILEADILKKEDSISLMGQEISVLQESVNQRIEESYKYSFIGTLEIFLNGGSLDGILRKTKYLAETREKDKEALAEMNDQIGLLRAEEIDLANKKDELEDKKLKLEEDKTQLIADKKELDSQKSEYNKLLSESKNQEAIYLAELKDVAGRIADTENAVQQLMLELYNTGHLGNGTVVSRGSAIGIDGHTGCAFGTHLHFAVKKDGVYKDPLPMLNSGTIGYPMSGVVITQYYSGSHRALDLVSRSSGNQDWSKTYLVRYGICSIVNNILDYRYNAGYSNWNRGNTIGEGATVYAATSGRVYYYVEDTNGDGVRSSTDDRDGKYAMVVSNDGRTITFYVHLKY